MDQYNETINSTGLTNGTITNQTFSDGHVTKMFLNALHNKENVSPTQLSGETFIVEERPVLDETVIKDNPMYGIQNTMYAHAVNKFAARIRRQNPQLHQGSFNMEKSTLSGRFSISLEVCTFFVSLKTFDQNLSSPHQNCLERPQLLRNHSCTLKMKTIRLLRGTNQ